MNGEKQQGGNTDPSWQRTDNNALEHHGENSPVPRLEELGPSDPRFSVTDSETYASSYDLKLIEKEFLARMAPDDLL
jgi:hypothetical protein